MIQFDCPKCLQQINARPAQAGQRIACPRCDVSLLVPSRQAGDFDDLFDADDELFSKNDGPADEDVPAVKHAAEEIVRPLADGVEATDVTDDRISRPSSSKLEAKTIIGDGRQREPESEPNAALSDLSDLSGADDSEEILIPKIVVDQAQSPVEIIEEDPFEVDVDVEQRLQIDGISDVSQSPNSIAIKCQVCESHLFVTTQMVAMEVGCPDCFSKIIVPQTTPQSPDADGLKVKPSQRKAPSKERSGDRGSLDQGVRPKIDPSFGLAPVQEDLLAAKSNPPNDDLTLEPLTEVSQDRDEAVSVTRKKPKKKSGLAKPAVDNTVADKPELGHPRKRKRRRKTISSTQESFDPYRARQDRVAADKKRFKSQQQPIDSPFPVFEFDQLFAAVVKLVTAVDVLVRCGVTASLLAAGSVIGHMANRSLSAIEDPTMGDTASMMFWRMGVGWLVFGGGTLVLWFFAGVVFRKTAAGGMVVDSWRIGPSIEWTSTFLLIGFSFAVAGLPLLMTGQTWAIAPLRFFLALPMLLSVWYTQSPFQIIAVDAFQNFKRQATQWKSVGLVVLALAAVAFVGGLLLAVTTTGVNVFTSLMGAMLVSMATLGYAAVAGWHSGKAVQELN